MPLYRLQSFKRIQSQEHEWTNVYHISAADFNDAHNLADLVVTAEQSIHRDNVFFTYYRLSQDGSPGVFQDTRVDAVGFFGEANDQLPLWNVARVSFSVLLGRPSFKFYRLPIQENEQTNGVLIDARREAIVDALTPLLAGPGTSELVDESGNAFASVSCDSLVRERQLHRRRRRRSGTGGL